MFEFNSVICLVDLTSIVLVVDLAGVVCVVDPTSGGCCFVFDFCRMIYSSEVNKSPLLQAAFKKETFEIP